jgi:hypothetical protein
MASILPWSLHTHLIRWSKRAVWTVGHSVQGTLIAGETGGGKSSGSGKELSLAKMRAGYGGLVLCAKPDEASVWIDRARQVGRSADLIVVRPGGRWRFNPFTHEAQRSGPGAGHVETLVALFASLLELTQRNAGPGSGGREGEQYWLRACLQLVRNFLTLLVLSGDDVTVDALYRAIVSAPTSLDQACSATWKQVSFCHRLLAQADERPKTEALRRDFGLTADYVLLEFPSLSDRTRSVIVSMFTSLIDCLNRGALHELFGTDSTFSVEDSQHGKIIICDLSVKEHGVTGLIANVLLKHVWQLAMERRDISKNPRPVFLWMDEAQHFLVSTDQLFMTTARSSRVATVLLTQNLPTLYAAFGGGEKGKAEADSLLGNCCTKIFHSNTCPVTNEWAASIIGRTVHLHANGNSTASKDWVSAALGLGSDGTTSAGFSESLEWEVQPREFTVLRNGGPRNRFLVDGILVQSGKVFGDSDKIWRRVTFSQR